MKKLKMLCFTFVAMLLCTLNANAGNITFAGGSLDKEVTLLHNYDTQLEYQWVRIPYKEYHETVEPKLSKIVDEMSAIVKEFNSLREEYQKANQAYNDAYAKVQAGTLSRTELLPYYDAVSAAFEKVNAKKEEYDKKQDAFNAELAKYAPYDSAKWQKVTDACKPRSADKCNGAIFDPAGYTTSGDAAVLWVDTKQDTYRYESKIYLYSAEKGEVSGDVECPVFNPKYCEVADGKYFGAGGNEVTKEVYEQECLPKVCKVENGKYYGVDGKEVDAETYNKECNPSCAVKDGKYYDKEGKEVSKKEYEKACNPSCKVENNKYYGPEGQEISKQDYEKMCTENPKTGLSLPFALGIMIIIAGVAGIITANKKKMFKQI